MWRAFLMILITIMVGSLGLLLIINELAVISPSLNAQNSILILQLYIAFFASMFVLSIIGGYKLPSWFGKQSVGTIKLGLSQNKVG